jgi:malate dehydrogenase
VNGRPLSEFLSAVQTASVVQQAISGGAAVVELLQSGSAFYAPAAAIATMVSELLRPTGRVLSVCARLDGEYGISGVHMGVPCVLGKKGVEKIVELPLAKTELEALQASAAGVKAQLAAVLS